MTKRNKPVLPDFEETAGFRASVLYLFPPESAEIVRKFGRELYFMILAGEPYYPEGESQTRREIDAAIEDLRHTQSFLEVIARKPQDLALEPPDLRLCRRAGKLAHALARILRDLEKELP